MIAGGSIEIMKKRIAEAESSTDVAITRRSRPGPG
jgi:hypothetical protein